MAKYSKAEISDQLARMRDWLQPGDTVYTILDQVSRSGMSRTIRVVVLKCENGVPRDLHPNYATEVLLGLRRAKRGDGVVIGGCGMDMGFEIVYRLGRAMFPDGFGEVGEKNGRKYRAKSKEHAAQLVARGVKFRGRNGDPSGWDTDGGYALKHRWL